MRNSPRKFSRLLFLISVCVCSDEFSGPQIHGVISFELLISKDVFFDDFVFAKFVMI